MARSFVARELVKLGGEPRWREDVVTDNGNWILDVHHLEIAEPYKLEEAINNIPGVVTNGIFAMCQDKALGDLVETSSNLAVVKTTDNEVDILASQRSNVMSNLTNQCNAVKAAFQLAGADVEQTDGYPAWQMNPDSQLTRLAVDSYQKLFGKEPIVRGIHAGLECGLFSTRYPHLDMVSFGPTLRDVHTPDERLLIPTVQMVWDHLLEILKNVPVK